MDINAQNSTRRPELFKEYNNLEESSLYLHAQNKMVFPQHSVDQPRLNSTFRRPPSSFDRVVADTCFHTISREAGEETTAALSHGKLVATLLPCCKRQIRHESVSALPRTLLV